MEILAKELVIDVVEVEGAAEDIIGWLVIDGLSTVNGYETDGKTLSAEAKYLKQQVEVEQNFVWLHLVTGKDKIIYISIY